MTDQTWAKEPNLIILQWNPGYIHRHWNVYHLNHIFNQCAVDFVPNLSSFVTNPQQHSLLCQWSAVVDSAHAWRGIAWHSWRSRCRGESYHGHISPPKWAKLATPLMRPTTVVKWKSSRFHRGMAPTMNRLAVIDGLLGITWSKLMLDKNLRTSAEGIVLCLCISSTLCTTSEMKTITASNGSLTRVNLRQNMLPWNGKDSPLLPRSYLQNIISREPQLSKNNAPILESAQNHF